MPKLSPLGNELKLGVLSPTADSVVDASQAPPSHKLELRKPTKKGKFFNFKSDRLLTLIIDFSLQGGSGTVNEKC